MTPNRHATAAARLADGFASHVERWARALGAAEPAVQCAREAARATSLATGEGHVCITLDELALQAGTGDDAAALRRALLASGVVGTAEAPGAMPLVLDADGRLYLHRYFAHEQRLAARLMRAARAEPAPLDVAATHARLADWFGHAPRSDADADADTDADAIDWQQLASALALRRRLTVISGGPGTGKTTTVVNLLACLIAQDPGCRIALAAPTGKAAARLTEAIRERAGHLPEAIRARLPADSSTIHRLLGVLPAGAARFRHHAGQPLPIDALVVDEASMLDLALAARLLDAVPPHARIVLLGDKDQLSAVEAGAVFSELCADPTLSEPCRAALGALCGIDPARLATPVPVQPSPLRDSVVWFTRNFRFATDSGIGRLAAAINAGHASAAVDALRAPADGSVHWFDDAGAAPGPATLAALQGGAAPYLDALRRDPGDRAAVFAAFGAFRVLCAVREGPRGVVAMNDRLTRRAREALGLPAAADARSPWFTGRPVIVLRNDPLLRLFNGDIGIALPAGGAAGAELAVFFEDRAAPGGFRAVSPLRLPAHETAFAMTVHKSQGSEFHDVLVLLPAQRSPVVTRELLYTAVTRARRRVAVAAGEELVAAAVRAPTQRRSGLIARLRDAAAGDD